MANLTEIEVTEDPVNAALKALRDASTEGQTWLIHIYRKLMRIFWASPGVDPQDICDRLGTRAHKVFVLGAMLRDMILEEDPGALTEEETAPLRDPTFHEDGTVTLAPLPEPEPEEEETP